MFDFRSASPDKKQDKEKDDQDHAEQATAPEETNKAADNEPKSRSASRSPAPNNDESHTNDNDAE